MGGNAKEWHGTGHQGQHRCSVASASAARASWACDVGLERARTTKNWVRGLVGRISTPTGRFSSRSLLAQQTDGERTADGKLKHTEGRGDASPQWVICGGLRLVTGPQVSHGRLARTRMREV